MTQITDPQVGGRLALDIETISPTLGDNEYPDFDDPEDFELLATALTYEPPDSADKNANQMVLWREGTDPTSEVAHLRDVVEVLQATVPSEIVTYNGDRFDFKILKSRAEIAGSNVSSSPVAIQMRRVLNQCNHLDLKYSAWEKYGDYTSLEDVLAKQDLPVRETRLTEYNHGHDLSYRSDSDPSYICGSDIPVIGEDYLRTVSHGEDLVREKETKAMLEDYALGDIEHLLTLADRHPF